ncbi:hypothetical protein CSIRO_2748 [Bradyrhizobiaceae bacterium SG-6C]|nr:hypothetical protein CSIRO_2748 [Bradyrhizobiaceae bacterium SG-6C]
MDVGEQETVHRRAHIDRRPDEDRNRDEHRLRQIISIVVIVRRIEHDEIRRRRRQEEDRRRWRRRKREYRIVEHQIRTIDIFVFVLRRRRHVVRIGIERRRWLERSGDIREPAARVCGMRAFRITLQVGPVGLLRVGTIGLPPCDRLAARGNNRPHPLRHRIVRIGSEKRLVIRNGVALEGCGVGVLRAEIADRLGSRGGVLIGLQRRRIERTVEEHEVAFELLRIPRHLRALGHVVDAQPGAVEHFRQRDAAGADHFRQRLRIRSVVAGRDRRDRSRRGVESDQALRLRLHQGKAAGERLAFLGERRVIGGVEHDNVGLERQRRQLADVVADPQAFHRNVGIACHRRIDRREVVLACKLQTIAGQIDHRDRIRPCLLCLLDEIAEGLPQRLAVEVAGADHIEASRLQRLRNQAGIVGGSRQRRARVIAVADHQRDTALLALRRRWRLCAKRQRHRRKSQYRRDAEEFAHSAHDTIPVQPNGAVNSAPHEHWLNE